MNITAQEAREAIERLEQFIFDKKVLIGNTVKQMAQAVKKGDFGVVNSKNYIISMYLKSIKETEEQIEEFTHELKKAEAIETEGEGWKVVIDFLEEMYESDMVWYKELKELSHDQLMSENKSTQIIGSLSETEAKKLFRKDVQIRFYKLVTAVKNKAGEHIQEITLERNDNNGLDGVVVGDKKTVRLETIIAGGYNIQRAHYRTLVK